MHAARWARKDPNNPPPGAQGSSAVWHAWRTHRSPIQHPRGFHVTTRTVHSRRYGSDGPGLALCPVFTATHDSLDQHPNFIQMSYKLFEVERTLARNDLEAVHLNLTLRLVYHYNLLLYSVQGETLNEKKNLHVYTYKCVYSYHRNPTVDPAVVRNAFPMTAIPHVRPARVERRVPGRNASSAVPFARPALPGRSLNPSEQP